jgi:two-component sensor histidine kinase
LAALRALQILDTPREAEFDEIVKLASRICNAPISVINLIDENRQWFKAETGLGVRETPLDTSICAHVILEPGLTVIPDTLQDQRMADNPLCNSDPHFRFYAGALLHSDDGYPVGTLCVLDHHPRDLDDLQRFALNVLAKQVMSQIKLRTLAANQSAARILADAKVIKLENAAETHDMLVREVDHRVKNSLSMVASMLNLQSKDASSEEIALQFATARNRVLAIAALHDQLHIAANYDQVDMVAFMTRLLDSIEQSLPPNVSLTRNLEPVVLNTKSAAAVGIIVNELVTNSVKHAFTGGSSGEIGVRLKRNGDEIGLAVWDTGAAAVSAEQPGGRVGLGMRIVTSSVEQLGGSLELLDNKPGRRVVISLPVLQK